MEGGRAGRGGSDWPFAVRPAAWNTARGPLQKERGTGAVPTGVTRGGCVEANGKVRRCVASGSQVERLAAWL